MSTPPVYPPGTTINDRYRLGAKLGTDGSVYEAYDRNLEKRVALKLLHPEAGAARSWDEARRLEQLRSRFLVDVINADVIIDSDIRFIVTPLLSGGDLEAGAAWTGLSLQEAVRYTQQVAAGVDRIHAAGMVHRDVKPANVLRRGDEVLVSDLQFCEILDDVGRADRNGSWCTLAPETAKDDGYCSVATDVYSLGATAFYLLSGQYPVDHTLSRREQKRRIERGDLRELRELAPHVSQAVGTVVRKALNFDAEKRYRTAEGFGNALVHAARDTRNWKRVEHTDHVYCLEGQRFRGRAAVDICTASSGEKVLVTVRHPPTGRRVAGVGDVLVSQSALVKSIQRTVKLVN